MKPTKIAYEEFYSDNSGVEFAVRFDATQTANDGSQGIIEIEHINKIDFPVSKIDWLIYCLQRIKDKEGL